MWAWKSMAICIDDLWIHVEGDLSDLVGMFFVIIKSYCWWKKSGDHQLRLVVYAINCKVLYVPGGAGILPNEQYHPLQSLTPRIETPGRPTLLTQMVWTPHEHSKASWDKLKLFCCCFGWRFLAPIVAVVSVLGVDGVPAHVWCCVLATKTRFGYLTEPLQDAS